MPNFASDVMEPTLLRLRMRLESLHAETAILRACLDRLDDQTKEMFLAVADKLPKAIYTAIDDCIVRRDTSRLQIMYDHAMREMGKISVEYNYWHDMWEAYDK